MLGKKRQSECTGSIGRSSHDRILGTQLFVIGLYPKNYLAV
jgi:hypothetical protein